MSEQDFRDATDAGVQAAEERYGHYMSNIAGLGAQAGDPVYGAETLEQPAQTMPAKSTLQQPGGPVGQGE